MGRLGFICCICIFCCVVISSGKRHDQRKFPDNFVFGVATASYQIEGAWNEDGKSENIWDRLTHKVPSPIKDNSTGDIAADSYHNYKRDVEMMRELGLDVYRFSLSWSRLLPSGFANHVNEAGVNYYNNLIDEMLKYNIQPIVTLYHWDLPQSLQDLGGFANPLISEWFEDYAKVAFERFGDRVKVWITFNEPREVCYQGYGTVTAAPAINATGVGDYLCVKNLVIAHARAYHLYSDNFKEIQGGEVGITFSISWYDAATDSEEDLLATELYRQSQWRIYSEPIFSETGGFPKEISERVAQKSQEQGFLRSRLPEFTEEENKFVKGTSDFLGINHYTAVVVSTKSKSVDNPVPSLMDDLSAGTSFPIDTVALASDWLAMVPKSLFKTIVHVSELYGNVPISVTENGWLTSGGLNDDDRIQYYRAALEDILDALDAGVNVKSYMAWSLMDNFEWMYGYVDRFGLYEVDFEDPARTRTPRKSAFVYKQILKNRVIDYEYEPADMIMTIDVGH